MGAVLDQINGRWGRGTLRSASVPTNPDSAYPEQKNFLLIPIASKVYDSAL